MTLQVFHPIDSEQQVAVTSNAKKIATQLLNECAAEIQQARDARDAALQAMPRQEAALAMIAELRDSRRRRLKVNDYKSGEAILKATEQQQAQVVLMAMANIVASKYENPAMDTLCHEILKSLLRRKLTYDFSEIEKMLTLVQRDSIVLSSLPLLSVLGNVERHVQQCGMKKSLRNQLNKLLKTYPPDAYCATDRKIGLRIKKILDGASENRSLQVSGGSITEPADHAARAFEINTGEAWTNALLVELGELSDSARENWHAMLDHCATARSSKPTKKFLKRSSEILDSIGHGNFIRAVSPALAAIGKAGESEKVNYGGIVHYSEPTQIHDSHENMLRGLVWTTSLVDEDELISVVGDAAEKCFQKIRDIGPRSPKIGNACLIALSSLASESAVAQLGRLKSRAKHVSTRKQIARAFDRAAENAGMTQDDLMELGVPRYGMNDVGTWTETLGEFNAVVTLRTSGKPELTWHRKNGKQQKTVPAAVKSGFADELKSLKKKTKDIEKLMPGIRQRIEQLFINDRSWTMSDFRARFLDHPVVGVIARRLIWNIGSVDAPISAFWLDDGFVSCDGKTVEFDEETRVSIWHPMNSSSDEVLRWRQRLQERQITQPFKQAHREIYILTDAERDTAIYSNRFAAHIVRQHQLAALFEQRGWRYDLQGDWDSWNAPFRDLPQHGLRVEFIIDPLEELNEVTESFVYTHLSTDQVRFLKCIEDESEMDEPVALEDVPKLVFSEIMRDVDLFVGVSSVGNDPQWQTREHGAYTEYWQAYSFGELSQSAQTRKQTLESILPQLKIVSQCSLDNKFLIVQGKLRTYKIHLGSGNILMSPDDQYLCIVQKRGSGNKRTDNIFLPFEGDKTMSLILSKAFLLAEDDKIKDQTIVNQIRMDRNTPS